MKNDTLRSDRFSAARLGRMLRINLTENARPLLMQATVVAGVLAIFMFIVCYSMWSYYYGGLYAEYYHGTDDPMWSVLWMCMWIFYGVFGVLSASQIGATMSTKPRRIVNLMVPATQVEKYLARWIIYILGFTVFFFAVFELLDLLRVAVARGVYPDCNLIHPMASEMAGAYDLNDYGFPLTGILLLMSVYTLGSYLWPRRPVVATSVVLVVLTMVCGFITGVVAGNIFGGEGSYDYPRASIFMNSTFQYAVAIVMMLLFWTVACLRYRQDEVVNRW